VVEYEETESKRRLIGKIDFDKFYSLLETTLFPYLLLDKISPLDFANCLVVAEIFPPQILKSTYYSMGIMLEEKEGSSHFFVTSPKLPPHCRQCSDLGYLKTSQDCQCVTEGNVPRWCQRCSFTGKIIQVVGPCFSCEFGRIARLKYLFDDKLLDECIRVRIQIDQ